MVGVAKWEVYDEREGACEEQLHVHCLQLMHAEGVDRLSLDFMSDRKLSGCEVL